MSCFDDIPEDREELSQISKIKISWGKIQKVIDKTRQIYIDNGWSYECIEDFGKELLKVVEINYISHERLKQKDKEAYEFMKDKSHSFWEIVFTIEKLEGSK